MVFNSRMMSMITLCAILLFPIGSLAQTEDYTFKLTQSSSGYQFWTTPPSERVFRTDAVPTDTGTKVKVYAAKNEFEPFQIVVKPIVNTEVTINQSVPKELVYMFG